MNDSTTYNSDSSEYSIEHEAGDSSHTHIIKTGPITIADVLSAIGGGSPFETNAGAIRKILKRGSNQTIQGILVDLRKQALVALQPPSDLPIPKPPAEIVDVLWTAAVHAAQVKTLARLESLSAQRDGLELTMKAQIGDIDSLTAQVDTLGHELEEAQDEITAGAEAFKASLETARSETAAQSQETDRLRKELEEVKTRATADAAAAADELSTAKADAARAADLAEMKLTIERQALQVVINNLTHQLSDSKALAMAYVSGRDKKDDAPAADSADKKAKK